MLVTNRERSFSDELKASLPKSTEVLIASGYVGPDAFVATGLEDLAQEIPVRVVVGRAMEEGLPRLTLAYLKQLARVFEARGGGIRVAAKPFHSKLYCLLQEDRYLAVWVGSSNFTGHGLGAWTEANVRVDDPGTANQVHVEAQRLWEGGVSISQARIPVHEPVLPEDAGRPSAPGDVQDKLITGPESEGLPGVHLTLLNPRTGEVPKKSGLNWWRAGGRERGPNEAYIALRKAQVPQAERVFGSVEPGTVLLAQTHDGERFELSVEGTQDFEGTAVGKQISTRGDKSTLGKWIMRQCLRLPEGTVVDAAVLDQYGRSTVALFRLGIDEITGRTRVLLDFSPPASPK